MELLTINSFLGHGHQFRLWVYESLDNRLPEGLQIADANDIIPEDQVFRYKNSNQFGHGKGSVSGFSDIFRYKLLYDHGGWWVDMDVSCLKPFDIDTPYFFRKHHNLSLVGNVMKCPPRSELMKTCFEEASVTVGPDNTDWHKPIEILANTVAQLDLEKYIVANCGPNDMWHEVSKFLYTSRKPPEHYYFIHWMNEVWRTRKLDKNDFMISGLYGRLLRKYGLVDDQFSYPQRVQNWTRFKLKALAAKYK